jgi:hypothetical protein
VRRATAISCVVIAAAVGFVVILAWWAHADVVPLAVPWVYS